MAVTEAQNPLIGENTCGSLLKKLQEIWDEVGESDEERDKMLLQLEQECLDVYKRKVEHATKSRAQLLPSLSDAKLELSTLLSALGEKSFAGIPDNTSGTIKEQPATITHFICIKTVGLQLPHIATTKILSNPLTNLAFTL